ncbi:MAG TPA: hypothetical protein PKD15_00440 [Candidatus Saccharibacteria bacterium]|jgi:hypothetical protein|nr:hypothetical protein [Candidatus Saccharibacteria bacterium]
MKKLKSGFGTLEILFVVLVLSLVAVAAWNIVTMKIEYDKELQTTQQEDNNRIQNGKTLTILDEKISFQLPDTFKVAEDCSKLKGATINVYSSAHILDCVVLNPVGETYTNFDQFSIDIYAFEAENYTDVYNWVKDFLFELGGGDSEHIVYEINALPAFYEIADYSAYGATGSDSNEQRLTVGILGKKYGVLIKTTLYKGDYYSAKNVSGIDYHIYKPVFDDIINSVRISE